MAQILLNCVDFKYLLSKLNETVKKFLFIQTRHMILTGLKLDTHWQLGRMCKVEQVKHFMFSWKKVYFQTFLRTLLSAKTTRLLNSKCCSILYLLSAIIVAVGLIFLRDSNLLRNFEFKCLYYLKQGDASNQILGQISKKNACAGLSRTPDTNLDCVFIK